jgi:phosphate/sulfate permease
MLRGRRQVRWRVAEQLAVAWVVTLPSALLAGAMVAWLVGRLT